MSEFYYCVIIRMAGGICLNALYIILSKWEIAYDWNLLSWYC